MIPESGSREHFKILAEWLKDCNGNHSGCRPLHPPSVPTRLLDVRGANSPTVRLIETDPSDSLHYVALSHPWGDTDKLPPFCTYRSNIDKFKQWIKLKDLPDTFRDAIITTRALGIQYLWIDSICIVQGYDGDFTAEASKMEYVFSSAYCVITASRASGQYDGFLKSRPSRDYVTFRQGSNEQFYVCATIDNFKKDVLEGALNKRGWVLQERALARRTIYFAENQTYWECGAGVRCETLARMSKYVLGAPHLPLSSYLNYTDYSIPYY